MIDEATLRHLYLEEQRSIRNIADLQQLPVQAVTDALNRYHIPRRPAGFRSKYNQYAGARLDEPTLRRLYVAEQRTIRDIAALYQVSTRLVYDAISRYGIPRRTHGRRQPAPAVIAFGNGVFDKAALERLYQEQGQSIAAIAAAVASSPSRVRSALIRWGIARRRRGRPYNAQTRGE
ncbi:MAG TPA: hypothetical protein VFU22_33205 [Roseiflexaceae bacterium]|nr:hypothetical protein [Roseiflexaceae bacterium]